MIELAFALAIASSNDLLEKCKTESQALNTARTIATCTAAGDDVNQTKPDRVEALKLLGMALMVEGDADLAENAFVKMLTLDPQATLGSDAGPNVQKVLSRAHAKVDEAGASATSSTSSTSTTATTATPNTTPPSTSLNAGGGLPKSTIGWTAAGAGGAFALASAAVVGAASWDYYFDRVKCGTNGAQCVPFKPMLFGLYPADKRADFFDVGPAWIAGASVAFAIGAGAAGAGVFIATGE